MTDSAPKPSVFIETYGCQMNVLDSELVQGQLAALGYDFVPKAEDAGIVLINTCSVRELSEQKVWSQLGRLGVAKRAERGDMVVGVLGCMAEREGTQILKRMPHVDIVCGPSNLDRLPTLIDNALQNKGSQLALAGHTSRRSATLEAAMDGVENLDLSRAFSPTDGAFQAYARITRGCNKFCSFCVVPFTRGPEVHRPPEQIVEEVRRLAAAGALEVTLLGQTVNHYVYKDGGRTTSFADLLWRVHEEVPELPRLRFITSYPRDFGDDALDVMAAAPRICRYLHIPAQSGSNRLLRLMNRGYKIEEYLDLIDRARARMPDIRLAGDMIVGFPSETDEEHQSSVELLKRVRYKSCFVFKYSPRSGTVAERRLVDDIPEEVKKERNVELLAVQSAISAEHHKAYMGTYLDVLVEGQSKLKNASPRVDDAGGVRIGWQKPSARAEDVRLVGRTVGDEIVAFDGPPELIGKIVSLKAIGGTPLTILAQYSQDDSQIVSPLPPVMASSHNPTLLASV